MQRLLLIMLSCGLLAACSGSDDLQDYITQVKARPPLPIEPLPTVRRFEAMHYQPQADRTPFVKPVPELAASVQETKKDCLQPEVREKQPLERFSLDNLSMRGTMGIGSHLWALVAAEGEVYRVAEGQYLGLNHGRIVRIRPDGLDVEETVPDGKGCWTKRETKLNLVVAD